jgi:hypothetical protein
MHEHISSQSTDAPHKRLPTNENEDKHMKTNTRFIKSITKAAAENDTIMPWARGKRRAEFIAKRRAEEMPQRKTA